MEIKVLEVVDIKKLWEHFDFNYFYPEELNEINALEVEIKNFAKEEDWAISAPNTLKGWFYCHAWFNNMIEGVKGRSGFSKLQYRLDMVKPVEIDGYSNSNNGAVIYFIPKVYVGGDFNYEIKFEIDHQNKTAKLYVK